MPPRVLSHDAYTMAWICALPLEMAAAKLILDEVHANLAQPLTDHNCYTLGSVHSHNIVIACLPSGVYGTISATTILAQMLPTFRSIKSGLMMCGLEMVVGIPSASSGGVIQYDHGKALHSRRFERVGALNKPPQVLLTAVSQLRSDYVVGEGGVKLSLQPGQAITAQISRPQHDLLFNPEYIHQSSNTGCTTCDREELVHRNPRKGDEPRIHYGVLKDPKSHDSIAQELGILCFEMEAAGLVDQLQCLVIRGVCDYCDSHKSKEWQGYAALAAAAYTKTLLQVVPVHRDEWLGGKRHWMVQFSRKTAFVGRENHITTLEKSVEGIGKSQIALELAYQVRDGNSEVSVFWIPCTSYESVEQVKAYLSHESSDKWLLVFDNADDMEMWMKEIETGPPLKNLLPQDEASHILFTTRNRKLAVNLALSNVVQIPDMDEVTNDIMILGGYLSLLAAQKEDMVNLLSKDFENDRRYADVQNPVTTAWLVSFYQIRSLDQLAVDYLSFMACISPRNIPQSLLPSAPAGNKKIEALGLLKAYSFLSEEAESRNLTLHRFDRTVETWIPKTVEHINKIYPEIHYRERDLWRQYLPHILSVIENNKFRAVRSQYSDLLQRVLEDRQKELGMDDEGTLDSMHDVGSEMMEQVLERQNRCGVFFRQGQYARAQPIQEQALEGFQKALGPKHLRTLDSVTTLAKAKYRRAMDGYVKEFGPQHEYTLHIVSNTGVALMCQGKYDEAEQIHSEVLRRSEETFGPEHPLTLISIEQEQSRVTKEVGGGPVRSMLTLYQEYHFELDQGQSAHQPPDTKLIRHNPCLALARRSTLLQFYFHSSKL
ncbi:hypothetical protein BDW59DRAFT_176835 [Aspergillus cavernicola]|uniref:Nucleoside phosphorylase domain-containing protein n=1 Tax=Aspergillus cavernicola TaxID=176166 RepID=A0ABR4HC78_9EURO